MALRGTATHRKIRRLGKRLGIDPCFALGVMEAIWHTTAEQQPDGGIGRLTDEDIADEILYSGNAKELIEAALSEKLLDGIQSCRLFVHDWHEWADDAVISKLIGRRKRFANGAMPRLTKYGKDAQAKIIADYEREPQTVRTMRTECESAHGAHSAPRGRARPDPVPEPVPDPVPEPEPEARQPLSLVPARLDPIPSDTEVRIRKIADLAPNPQDYQSGLQVAIERVKSAVNPEAVLKSIEVNVPLWFEAMKDGRARMKTFRFVMTDEDYMRKPREPTGNTGISRKQAESDAFWDRV